MTRLIMFFGLRSTRMTPEGPQQVIYDEASGRSVAKVEVPPYGLLTREQIFEHIAAGKIIIDPFSPENVGGASVDVCLGRNFYRERKKIAQGVFGPIVNLWDDEAPQQLWVGPFEALRVEDFLGQLYGRQELWPSLDDANIDPKDLIIVLQPDENILAHTEEFVGGTNSINTSMQARSSMGRSHITVCRCAGYGDPGYINRWTMEVTNNSREHPVLLVVGRRVAQIIFWAVQSVDTGYGAGGKYQNGDELAELKNKWRPEHMLPRLFLDREAKERIARMVEAQVQQQRPGPQYAFPPDHAFPRDESHGWEELGPEARSAGYNVRTLGLTPDAVKHITRFLRSGVAEYVF